MQFSAFDYAMWLLTLLLHLGILTVMAKRKLIRELPIFSAFVIWSLVTSVALFVGYRLEGYATYFYGFWAKEGVMNALIFATLYELYAHVFKNYKALQRLGAMLFWWTGIVLLLVATVMAASAPGIDTSRLISALTTLERSVRVIQVGLLLFLVVFTSYFKLSWRNYIFGLALGFGVYAAGQLIAVSLRAHLGPQANQLWGKASVIAYVLGALIWTKYLSVVEPVVVRQGTPQREELERWNQALTQLLYQ
jgi:hypothetical protein